MDILQKHRDTFAPQIKEEELGQTLEFFIYNYLYIFIYTISKYAKNWKNEKKIKQF